MAITKVDENNLATWPVRKLKARAIGLYSAIYQAECFSSGDLRDYDAIKFELQNRGYDFEETRSLSITKGIIHG